MPTITQRVAGGRAGEREREDTGPIHPRALAASEQLGPLGSAVRRGRVRAGYPVLTGRPRDRRGARANPDVLAKKTLRQVADHTAEVIGRLTKKPAVIGHSTGGLLGQIIADRGLSAVTVAIDPGRSAAVLPPPISALRSSMPVLGSPLNWAARAQAALRDLPRGGAGRGADPWRPPT